MERLVLEIVLRTTLIAAGTALVLGLLRVKTASARHAAWTGVLALMLLLPAWTAWGPKAQLRVLPSPAVRQGAMIPEPSQASVLPAMPEAFVPAPPRVVVGWRELLAGIYALGSLWLLLRLAIGTIRANRLTSANCVAPITVGLLRPRVILPESWTEWTPQQLEAILTHEHAHVRRHDVLVQWLALLNRALFWFHPLAWWLERKLAGLAEEACDNAVLNQGHDPGAYAQCLLDVERSVMRAGTRFAAIGMAMPGSALPQRVKKIFDGASPARISRSRMVCAIAACAVTGGLFGAGTLARVVPDMPLPLSPARLLPSAPKPPVLVAQAPRTPIAPVPAAPAVAPKLAFEVAAIKPAEPMSMAMINSGQFHNQVDDAIYDVSNISMMNLITMAYGTPAALVSGPNWMNDQFFSVSAKLPAGATRSQIPAMMRQLLAERFKLAIHLTQRVEPVYLLTVGKQGIKFKESTGDLPPDQSGCAGRPGRNQCRAITMTRWAVSLSQRARTMATVGLAPNNGNAVDLPVVDQTGLTGVYDFDLEWLPPGFVAGGGRGGNIPPPSASTNATTIFEAIEAIGLKLEPAKHAFDVVVIDHVEKTPTEN